MKKAYKYLFILLCLMFLNCGSAFAASTVVKCSYNAYKNVGLNDSFGTFTITQYDNGKVQIDKAGVTSVMVTYAVKERDFNNAFKTKVKNSNTCPTLRACYGGDMNYDIGIDTAGCETNIELKPTILENNTGKEEVKEKEYCSKSLKIGNLSYTIRFFKDTDGMSKYTLKKPNGDVSDKSGATSYVQFDGKNFYLTSNKYYSSSCASLDIYLKTDDNLVYHITEEDLSQSEQEENYEIPEAPHDPVEEDAPESTPITGTCPLGADVTKDIAGIWKIIRIAGPLLAVALSILDAVLALTKGDSEAEMKKVATKFGKRVAYVILLIFLNIILNAILDFALGISNGCDLQDNIAPGTSNTTPPPNGNPESGECFSIKNSTECGNNDRCYWDVRCKPKVSVNCTVLKGQDCNERYDCELVQNGPKTACRVTCKSMGKDACLAHGDRCTLNSNGLCENKE